MEKPFFKAVLDVVKFTLFAALALTVGIILLLIWGESSEYETYDYADKAAFFK